MDWRIERVTSGVSLQLTPEHLIGRFYRLSAGFRRQCLASRLAFRSDGSISGHLNPNEARWDIVSGQLVILNADNRPTCVFTSQEISDGTLSLSGRSLLQDDGSLYYLNELPIASRRIAELPDTLTFEGEFGEELNSFLPYIHWLYQTGDLGHRKIKTYAGMEPFYFFLDDPHQLILHSHARRYVEPAGRPSYYLHQSGLMENQAGLEWTPDYRSHYATDLGFNKPLLVVHNKYTDEWGEGPANFLRLETLDKIFASLKQKYQIVFFEATRAADFARGYSMDHQATLVYNDVEVAHTHPEVVVFSDLLRQTSDTYNLLKLKVFSSCFHFITVQGGNAHMCALFPGSLVAIQHTKGSEEWHAYQRGIFQYLSNPRPIYLIGRDGAALLDIVSAFNDCEKIHDRVHLGPRGFAVCERYNPQVWTLAPTGVVRPAANSRSSLNTGEKTIVEETLTEPSSKLLLEDVIGRTFRFGRVDGSSIGVLTLKPNGTISGYKHNNEAFWLLEEGKLLFLNNERVVTTVFDQIRREGSTDTLCGAFLPRGPGAWHTLTEITESRPKGVIAELISALYGDDGPLSYAVSHFKDNGYPHTNIKPELVESVVDVVRPRFWLEIGSMLGGSAICVAKVIKSLAAPTEIVCVDPFTGDVNMWAWEQPKKLAGEWQFLRVENGRPTIYDRFLANVATAGYSDVILPIAATSIVGVKLLERLVREQRLSSIPSVIYLDSAHEPDETFLELSNCWRLLPPNGVLMGDDWGWDAVRNDVLRFARTVAVNSDLKRKLAERHRRFSEQEGILLDQGQWVLAK